MIYSFIYLRFGMHYGFMHNRELVDGLFQAPGRLHSSAASNFVTTSEAIKLNVVNLMALNLQLNAAQLQ